MKTIQSREQERAAFAQAAEEMYERVVAWREAHPEADFDEIAAQVGVERRSLMGQLLAQLATQPAATVEALEVTCPECGEKAEGKGQKKREVSHREGDVSLRRGYRYCPGCGSGFFPPGSEVEADGPRLESGDGGAGGALGDRDPLV